ncbi:M4 family metallopeptidase [Nonomuraea sp. NEAU-A123]|uniref:M4 family metallopeptidase n=1 Tax=Nonomuraea sp. NEAU-A123 TaxID=2839649 RepID=UPI001BE40B3F|nr:M4 family metallopeptidase [Nonomuraea sp. NEAU-A123]MBT2226031.1 M4 family metallopeptidase [Nonomuraea sp. NEAU-A123]
MNPKLRLGAAAILALALTITAPAGVTSANAQAADPPSPSERGTAVATAQSVITSSRTQLLAADQDAFSLSSSIAGVNGIQHLTYTRTYAGLPVFGGEVVITTDKSGKAVSTIDTGQQTKIALDTKPQIAAQAAADTARNVAPKATSISTPALVVHAATPTPRLAWEVVAATDDQSSIMHVYVDARDGQVIDKWDQVVDGTGNSYYNGNPVTIDTSPSYSMVDPTRTGVQCGGQNGAVYTKSTDSWGNGSGTNLETACVDALFAVQHEWNMLRDWLGRNGINGSGRGYPARVGLNQANAFWNGSYASFGRNSASSRQATSMDVVGHEFGHGVFQFSGGSGGSGNESGGLNESTGDIFGALTEAYANEPASLDPPDYLVGEEVNLVGSGAIRNMYNPSALGHPNCYSSSIPSTEVHAAAGPQNHWFYLLAEGTNPSGKPASSRCDGGAAITGVGVRKAGQIFMTGLNMKTSPWTHAKARVATLRAARTLYTGCVEFNVIKAAWSGVNVPAQSGEPTCP